MKKIKSRVIELLFKGPGGDFFSFVGHMLYVTSQLCHCHTKAAIDNQ